MSNIRFFISFSSKDGVNISELMSDFKSQNIDFWDYSDFNDSIKLSDVIENRLYDEIDHCDYFIAMISRFSVDKDYGKYTRRELEYAIKKGYLEQNRILSIVLPNEDNSISEFLGPYAMLENIFFETLVRNNIESRIRITQRFCEKLKIVYVPRTDAHYRMPFHNLFEKEIWKLAHDNSAHIELMRIIGEFNEYYKNENYEYAYFLIELFVLQCKYKIKDYPIIYPLIVKGGLESHLQLWDKALESYKQVLKIAPNNPDAYGGIGKIQIHLGKYQDAAENYQKAMHNSSGEQIKNERLNYLIALIANKTTLTKDDARFINNFDTDSYKDDEKHKVMLRKAILLYHINEFEKAYQLFESIGIDRIDDTNSITYYYSTLLKMNKVNQAKEFLKKVIYEKKDCPTINKTLLRHHLSDLYYQQGQIGELREIYENELLKPEVRNRSIMIRYARILKKLGKTKEAQEICDDIVNGKILPTAKTREDFYFDGFAQYLLGNSERARYDYQRSDKFDVYYEKIN